MKKIVKYFVVLCLLLVLTSCVVTNLGDYNSDAVIVEQSTVNGKNLADVELLAGCDEDNLYSYFLFIKNITNNNIFIDWSKSSLIADGQTSYPFEKGVKLEMAVKEPLPRTLIEKGSSYANTIFSKQQISFNEDTNYFQIVAFDNAETTVKICITDGTNNSYYIFNTYLNK